MDDQQRGRRKGGITNVAHHGGDVGSILGRRLKGKGRQCIHRVNAIGPSMMDPLRNLQSIFSRRETEIEILHYIMENFILYHGKLETKLFKIY